VRLHPPAARNASKLVTPHARATHPARAGAYDPSSRKDTMDPLQQVLTPELIIPLIAILMPVVIVLIVAIWAHKRQERKHQTIVNLIEKGLPVPPQLLGPVQRREGSPLMRALTLIGLGVGLSAFLFAMFGLWFGIWAVGLIPFAIGIAQLIALKLEPRRPAATPTTPAPMDLP
jgi:hypothetical protein